MTAPKQIPILFNAEMVRAILRGEKTQTRRPMNPQPEDDDGVLYYGGTYFSPEAINAGNDRSPPSPFGQPGDLLEARLRTSDGREMDMLDEKGKIWLRVTDVRVERGQDINKDDAKAEGVECRTDLSWAGGTDESFYLFYGEGYRAGFHHTWNSIYAKKPGMSWDDNPWVWAVTFERCDAPQ